MIYHVIIRGIHRGELPADTNSQELLDLLAGPIVHRRAVSAGTVDPGFAGHLVHRVLRAYQRPR